VKARATKKCNIIKNLSHTKWETDQLTLLKIIHQMIILPTLRSEESAYGSATNTLLKSMDLVHNKGIKKVIFDECNFCNPRNSFFLFLIFAWVLLFLRPPGQILSGSLHTNYWLLLSFNVLNILNLRKIFNSMLLMPNTLIYWVNSLKYWINTLDYWITILDYWINILYY
jgi:hypothetical protein